MKKFKLPTVIIYFFNTIKYNNESRHEIFLKSNTFELKEVEEGNFMNWLKDKFR